MFYAILAAALVVLDQIVKYLVRAVIPLGGNVPFIPYLLDLTYVQNTGAAFSMLRSHTWLLTLTSTMVVLAMCALIVKGFFKNRLGLFSAALVLAGGMGNLIDRVVFGFVTDCCITVGVPLLFLYVWFYVGKDGKKDAEAPQENGAENRAEHETDGEPQ